MPYFNPAARQYRPVLPSLEAFSYADNPNAVEILHNLARGTDLGKPATLAVDVRDPPSAQLAVKGWGIGWLQAAFSTPGLRELPVVLVDDTDVDAYVAALNGLDSAQLGFKHSVALGAAVTPEALCALLSSAKLPSAALVLQDLEPAHVAISVIGWAKSLQLDSTHLRALHGRGVAAAANLQILSIPDAKLLTDRDLALLARAAPGLRSLQLLQPAGESKLTDLGMYALLACRQLEVVEIAMAGKVTAQGVAVLLTVLAGLQQLRLEGCLSVQRLLVELHELDASIAEQWSIKSLGAGSVGWDRSRA
jgi:hypothetical protein